MSRGEGSWAGSRGPQVPCLERAGPGLGSLYSEAQCIRSNGHMGPPWKKNILKKNTSTLIYLSQIIVAFNRPIHPYVQFFLIVIFIQYYQTLDFVIFKMLIGKKIIGLQVFFFNSNQVQSSFIKFLNLNKVDGTWLTLNKVHLQSLSSFACMHENWGHFRSTLLNPSDCECTWCYDIFFCPVISFYVVKSILPYLYEK